MPLHDYHCHSCDAEFEHWCSIAELDDPVICFCGKKANRVFRTSNIAVKVPFWVDMPQEVIDKVERGTEKEKNTKVKLDLGKFGKDKQ